MSQLLSDYDYTLPAENIAQEAIEPRDHAKLLHIDIASTQTANHIVRDLPDLLNPGDLLIFNDTKVFPARLFGKKNSGGQVEVLLVHSEDVQELHGPGLYWQCFVRGKVRVGSKIILDDCEVEVMRCDDSGVRLIRFPENYDVFGLCDRIGHIPLPPYIKRDDREEDKERYQCVYAEEAGSVAAPTAGLHFTDELLEKLQQKGIERAFVRLHVGPGTFQPVSSNDLSEHEMHAEWCSLTNETVEALNACRARGNRIIAVGTTSVRTLESAYRAHDNSFGAWSGWTKLFLHPPQKICSIDGLMTNFHLPRSSLLMLVSCLCGRENLMNYYQHAIENDYRFYSYGDAMLML